MTLVRTETIDGVTTITMADLDRKNALGTAFVGELRAAFDAALATADTRVIVLTNEGRVFCAGADLKEASGGGRDTMGGNELAELLSLIQDSPKPVIGRVAGHAMGGGVGLVASLDVSIAADDIKMGFTEVRLGVAPAIISVVCLPKMRPADAKEAFLRGNRFDAARAAELGIINRAVPADQLDAAVAEVTTDIVAGGPLALAAAKELIAKVPDMEREAAFEWTSQRSAQLFNSPEAGEGMAAFLEKRSPSWVPPSA
jgi:methylglutaconyl-CoA hydratase